MPTGSQIDLLFDALHRGHEEDLRRLIPPLQERLTALAKERLRGQLPAEDVVQETLATLWEKRASVRSSRHLLPFVFQVLRNKIGNVYSKARRVSDNPGRDVRIETVAADPASSGPESEARANELERILDAALSRCAAEHPLWGKVLELVRAGRSPAEIREELDIPMATVHTRIHRARKRLREILENDYGMKL